MQKLPPTFTLDALSDFETGVGAFTGTRTGSWSVAGGRYVGVAPATGPALSSVALPHALQFESYLELSTSVRTSSVGGIFFDAYSETDFKYVVLDVANQRVVFGHRHGGRWVIDASFSRALTAGTDYTVELVLKGASLSVMLNGSFVGSHGFNSAVVDGTFGLLSSSGTLGSGWFRVRTDDPAYAVTTGDDGAAPPPAPAPGGSGSGSAGSGGAATVPSVSVDSVRVTEGDRSSTTVLLAVRLSAASSSHVTVTVGISGGTASGGSDYAASTATLSFAPGETVKYYTLTILADRNSEPDETVQVSATPVDGASGATGGTVTITDDDSRLLAVAAGPGGPGARRVLSARAARALLPTAVQAWAEERAGAGALRGVRVVVRDLPGARLGEVRGRTIVLDATAAGWGWTLDGRAAVGPRIDLLAVLVHEVGHLLGRSHAEAGRMDPRLAPISTH
ncbi:MAG: Calx-beta domain-containing protein, partial [Nocardioidaceae bacterium]